MTTNARRRRLRRTLVPAMCTLAAPVLLATAAGCGLSGGGPTVLLFGDSLTVLVGDDVKRLAGDEFDVEVSGTWGVRIDEVLDVAADLAADPPDQVVINLGTNNVLQRHDVTATAADLESLLQVFDGSDCVYVVNINERINRMGEDYATDAAAVNAELRRLAERRLDTHIIDWNAIVAEHADDGIISDDGVHPDPEGVELLADAYLDALRDC